MSETPQWFWDYVESKPESNSVEVAECDINYLSWSDTGDTGLLFVHGHNAHAHWWDFIAPRFKDQFHTVGLDLSGMGDSDHRDEYSADLYAQEILAVADKAGLGNQTYLIAHSFGGIMAMRTVARNPDRFCGLVLIDSGVKHPDDQKPRDVERWSKPKIYPDRNIAQSRFRLQPPQTCANQYLVDHIARNSLDYVDEGWTWKFDDELNTRMQATGDIEEDLKAITGNFALIYGELSESFSARSADYMKSLNPGLDVYSLADAQHHLFLDQPEAFMTQLEGILAGWQG